MTMDKEEGGTSFSPEGKATPAAAARILGDCRNRTVAYAGSLPGQFFEVLQKDLAERAANVFSNPDQGRIIEGLRILEKNKARLTEVFPARFGQHFNRQLQPDTSPGRVPAGDGAGTGFSLVEDSELEESLAVNTLIGKLRERYSDELFGLGERTGELMPGMGGDTHRLPLGPDAFCHAFRDALTELELETATRVHGYRLFERALVPGLGQFYAELNKYLIEQGVLPQLKAKIRTQPSVEHPAAAAGRSSARRGGVPGGGPGLPGVPAPDEGYFGEMVVPMDEQAFQAMQHLLGSYPAVSQGGSRSPVGQSTAMVYLPATPMLIDTLSSLQHDPSLVEHTGELLRGGLKQHVVGRFSTLDAQGRSGVINQIDDETIDVISMIFDYIFDDKTLPDFIKALIGRLQIPVLKVAIVDREFFSNKAHPVRQMLNDLAYAGVGWHEESDAVKDRLYDKMEEVVRRILNDFDDDVGLFATVLGEFRVFLEEEKKSFALEQQRIGAEVHEAEKLEQIRLAVAEEIASRVGGRDLPPEVREFLATTWRQLLTEATLAEGRDGAGRTRALRVMDDLLWSLEPKSNPEQRRRLGVLLPILLEELREGQRQLNRGEEEINAFIAVLEQHHFTSMKGGRMKEPPTPQSSRPVPASPVASPQQKTDTPAAGHVDEIDRMIREISGDIENLPAVDMEELSGFGDLIDSKDPNRQSGFDRMMAEMGFEADGDAGPRIEDNYTQLVRKLELGSWLELAGADGKKLRVKLAWVGDAYTNYSFVNRQFKVVAERPLYVLAEEFRNNTARVIEDVALFDRALDGVISGIMKFARPRNNARHA
ncbi:MAG: DUF1631 domain-containing protein [Gammaproteobacteria bacterium]